MKKLLSILVLTIMFVPSTFAFTDYGQDNEGRQCASVLKGDGTCNIVYSNDRSVIGARSMEANASLVVAQPNAPTVAERTARQNAVRAQICLIIGC